MSARRRKLSKDEEKFIKWVVTEASKKDLEELVDLLKLQEQVWKKMFPEKEGSDDPER